jgi:hypothetical protein
MPKTTVAYLSWLKLVISDAHFGLTKSIHRQLHGCVSQRCGVHHRFAEGFDYARNLLRCVHSRRRASVQK